MLPRSKRMETSITQGEAKPPDPISSAQTHPATEGTEDYGKGLPSTQHGKMEDSKARALGAAIRRDGAESGREDLFRLLLV